MIEDEDSNGGIIAEDDNSNGGVMAGEEDSNRGDNEVKRVGVRHGDRTLYTHQDNMELYM